MCFYDMSENGHIVRFRIRNGRELFGCAAFLEQILFLRRDYYYLMLFRNCTVRPVVSGRKGYVKQ